MKRIFLRTLYLLLTALVILAVFYAWPRLPIITSYASKGMCSSVFMAGRDPALVSEQDLSFFPISLAKTRIHEEEQSVTASLFGLARRKAVYREGLGATPVADFSEEEIRAQAFSLPMPPSDPDTIDWPLGNRMKDTLFPEIRLGYLDSVLTAAFDAAGEELLKKTHAVMVVYKGIPVMDRYADGIGPDTRLIGWSMSKSIQSAMVGILVRQGKMFPAQPVPVEAWAGDERKAITLDNLLHMNSGLDWVEDYFDLSDVTKMLYSKGDMYAYAISRPLANPPGEVWYYSSGTTNIIAGLIRKCFENTDEYYRFPREALFNRLGMRNTLLEADASGTFVGSSYCFASTSDWARFALLYLNKGVFAGDTLLDQSWVDYTRIPVPGSDNAYGAQFWLNKGKELPDCPDDVFYLRGFNGQRVFIVPSRELIVIRLGYSSGAFDFNRFLSSVLKAFQDS